VLLDGLLIRLYLKSSRKHSSSQVQIWILVILLTLIWGSSFILLKWSLRVFSPGQVFAGRMMIAALVLSPFAIRAIPQIPRDKWLPLLTFACVANIATTLLNALALKGITSSLGGILNTITPLVTLLIGVLLYRQRMRWAQGLGLILGLVGTVVLILYEADGKIGNVNTFALYAVAATICSGFFTNIIKFNLRGLSVLQFSSVAFLMVLPVSLGYGWYANFFSHITEVAGGWRAFGYLAILGVFTNAVGLLMLGRIIQLSNPVFASLITYLIPIVALFWGYLDGELISWPQVISMSVIIGSVWLINRFQNVTPPPAKEEEKPFSQAELKQVDSN
jgi:drug/metabolite transporter (DMT)-like permease